VDEPLQLVVDAALDALADAREDLAEGAVRAAVVSVYVEMPDDTVRVITSSHHFDP